MSARSEAVARSEAYYDSGEADSFYQTFWGGEDIHIGGPLARRIAFQTQ